MNCVVIQVDRRAEDAQPHVVSEISSSVFSVCSSDLEGKTEEVQVLSFLHEKLHSRRLFTPRRPEIINFTPKMHYRGYPHPKYYQNECDFGGGYQKEVYACTYLQIK